MWERPLRRACSRKSGPVSMTTTRSPAGTASFQRSSTEGRSRRSCGSAEVQTSQVHPCVGTPIEGPVPRNVSRPSIDSLADTLRRRWRLNTLHGNHAGQLHERHTDLKEHGLQSAIFRFAEV